MSDIETIKERIKKLMAYSGDIAATEGEINNAMTLAQKLIDQHNLDLSEFEKTDQPQEIIFDKIHAHFTSSRICTWEMYLGMAISKLYGTLNVYLDKNLTPNRKNGIIKLDSDGNPVYSPSFVFYGPQQDVKEAAELFNEWILSISAMAIMRWGGAYRGPGAQYSYGFVTAIYNKVCSLDTNRQLVQTTAPKQLSNQTTAITLTQRYNLIKKEGEKWLKEKHKITIKGSHSSGGYRRDNSGAYDEGYSHGKKSNFSKKGSSCKQLT